MSFDPFKSREPSPTAPTQVFLSIDWDFFLWRAFEGKDKDLYLSVPENQQAKYGKSIYAGHIFDWGHNEMQAPWLQDSLWQQRWAAIAKVGIDPHVITGIRPEIGGVHPADFWHEVDTRHPLVGSLYTCDSHAQGLSAISEVYARSGGSKLEVIHFDAHHDLGYDANQVKREVRDGRADCGSWLFHAMRLKMVDNVTVVYPNWRHPEPFPEHLNPATKVHFTTWDDWSKRNKWDAEPAAAVVLARSSAWSPPWHDGLFEALAMRIGATATSTYCLDCLGASGTYHACKPREWDGDAASKIALMLREMDAIGTRSVPS